MPPQAEQPQGLSAFLLFTQHKEELAPVALEVKRKALNLMDPPNAFKLATRSRRLAPDATAAQLNPPGEVHIDPGFIS